MVFKFWFCTFCTSGLPPIARDGCCLSCSTEGGHMMGHISLCSLKWKYTNQEKCKLQVDIFSKLKKNVAGPMYCDVFLFVVE